MADVPRWYSDKWISPLSPPLITFFPSCTIPRVPDSPCQLHLNKPAGDKVVLLWHLLGSINYKQRRGWLVGCSQNRSDIILWITLAYVSSPPDISGTELRSAVLVQHQIAWLVLSYSEVCQIVMAVSQPPWEWAISVLGGPRGVSDWFNNWALDGDTEKHI